MAQVTVLAHSLGSLWEGYLLLTCRKWWLRPLLPMVGALHTYMYLRIFTSPCILSYPSLHSVHLISLSSSTPSSSFSPPFSLSVPISLSFFSPFLLPFLSPFSPPFPPLFSLLSLSFLSPFSPFSPLSLPFLSPFSPPTLPYSPLTLPFLCPILSFHLLFFLFHPSYCSPSSTLLRS